MNTVYIGPGTMDLWVGPTETIKKLGDICLEKNNGSF